MGSHFSVLSVMDLDAVQHQVRREPVRASDKITLRQRALEGHHDGFRKRHGVRRSGDPAEGVARQFAPCSWGERRVPARPNLGGSIHGVHSVRRLAPEIGPRHRSDEDQTELQDQSLVLAQCLRDLGHDVADPSLDDGPGGLGAMFGALDREDPSVQADLEACQAEAFGEDGAPFGGAGGPGGRGAAGGQGQ